MELSPLEIRSQKFSKKLRGYDTTEVENFLDIVSKDLEKLYGEYYNLKEEIVKKNREIADYKEKDKSISEAILMVQSISNDIRKVAIAEAENIKRIALAEAEKIVDSANAKYIDIVHNTDDLLNKRLMITNSLKNMLSINMDLIEREINKKFEISFSAKKKDIASNTPENNKGDAKPGESSKLLSGSEKDL